MNEIIKSKGEHLGCDWYWHKDMNFILLKFNRDISSYERAKCADILDCSGIKSLENDKVEFRFIRNHNGVCKRILEAIEYIHKNTISMYAVGGEKYEEAKKEMGYGEDEDNWEISNHMRSKSSVPV